MSKIVSLLQLRMLPAGANFGLLVLRIGFGLPLLWLHGWGKLKAFSSMAPSFMDPFGIGGTATFTLLVFAEVVCAALLIVGLFTRFAALVCAIAMAAAFWYGHDGRLTGEGNGEMAFLYLIAFLAILFAGPGRYAVDSKLGQTAA